MLAIDNKKELMINNNEELFKIVEQLINYINPDYKNEPHLKDSVDRVKNYYNEIFKFALYKKQLGKGYSDTDIIISLLKITSFENDEDDIIINNNNKNLLVGPIRVYSVCAHHFAPIIGNVWISYAPTNKILGLSKFSRIAKLYAKQPIVQELYTEGLYKIIKDLTNSNNVNIITYMRHLCMESRGINDTNSITLYYVTDDNTILDKIKLEKP